MLGFETNSPSARTACILLVGLAGCAVAQGQPEPRLPAGLMGRAEAEGAVRVIVELEIGPGDIRAAQDAVLQALEGTTYRVTRRYRSVPFLALEASAEALRRLSGSPAVRRVQEDRVASPQTRTP